MLHKNRATFEHIQLPGIYVDDPAFIVIFLVGDEERAVFGGYFCSKIDLDYAVAFRATQLMGCSVFCREMQKVRAFFKWASGEFVFRYDKKRKWFVTEC